MLKEETDRKTRFQIFQNTAPESVAHDGIDLKIIRRERGTIILLDIVGSVDLYNVRELRSALQKLVTGGKAHIVVNLRDLATIDSTGVAVLLDTQRQLRKRSGDLRLLHAGENVRELFRITRLSAFFEIFEDETAAIAAFSPAALPSS